MDTFVLEYGHGATDGHAFLRWLLLGRLNPFHILVPLLQFFLVGCLWLAVAFTTCKAISPRLNKDSKGLLNTWFDPTKASEDYFYQLADESTIINLYPMQNIPWKAFMIFEGNNHHKSITNFLFCSSAFPKWYDHGFDKPWCPAQLI